MGYTLVYTDVAREDIEKLKKSGDMVAIRKLARMLEELIDHPLTGSGKPRTTQIQFFWLLVTKDFRETPPCRYDAMLT